MSDAVVGVIGLGPFGIAVAGRLRGTGHQVRVFDPSSQSRRMYVVDGGAGTIDSPQGVARLCEVIVIASEGDLTIRNVMLGPAGIVQYARPGTIVVDMTSDDPALTESIARALVPRGAVLIDAAPIGTNQQTAAGAMILLCSGSENHINGCRSVLNSLASRIVEVGDLPGAARAARAIGRLYGAVNLVASVEALLIGKRAGIDPAVMLAAIEELRDSGGMPPLTVAEEVLSGRLQSGHPLDQLIRDMDAALATAHSQHVPAMLSRLVREIAEAAHATSPGRDSAEIVRWFEVNTGASLTNAIEAPEPERAGPLPISVRSQPV